MAACRSAQQELVAHLLDCWTECSPAQLGVAPELPAVQCMAAILACLDLLLEHTGGHSMGLYCVGFCLRQRMATCRPGAGPHRWETPRGSQVLGCCLGQHMVILRPGAATLRWALQGDHLCWVLFGAAHSNFQV